MCGIIGVLANRPAAPLILDGLRRLEYRGYDSAGVALLDGGVVDRRRARGKLRALEAVLAEAPAVGRTGLGHTRWATHGAPTEGNAHPHRAGPVTVVHNGIIENFRALRALLEAAGRRFESETDTETAAQLCAHFLEQGSPPTEAAAAAIARLEGAFALVFMFDSDDDLLVCASRGAPLAIGFDDGEVFVGSDALALAPLAPTIAYLENGDVATVRRGGVRIVDATGAAVVRAEQPTPVDAALVGKDGYRHFMAKEIHEQPTIAAYAVSACVSPDRRCCVTPAATVGWDRIERITLVACGTAHYACHVAKYWFETVARLPVEIDVASEFRYRASPLPPAGVAVLVSQSGETADTLAALRYARAAGQTTVAVVNAVHSTMAREADIVMPIHAGAEIGVASTKAFVGQLIALAAMALEAARARGAVDAAEEIRLIDALATAPRALADTIALEPRVAELAADIVEARDVLFIGRGQMYPLALEGALKLKELTYIHAEGYAAGELKHGPIALIDAETPVIALAPRDALFEKTFSNVQEVMARRGRVILITDPAGAREAEGTVWRLLAAPQADPFVAPIAFAPIVQLLAYHAAVLRGADVDQPRNLAKSVTVE